MVLTRYFESVDTSRTYELLVRLGDLLRAEERRVGQELGLSSVHLHALGYLARANRYSNSAATLAEYLGVTKGTASQTVAVLVERELVDTRRDERDGRRVHLALTDAGRAVVEAAHPPPLLARAATLLDAQPVPADIELGLEALLRAIQRAGGSRAFGVCHTCRHFRDEAGGFRCGLTDEPLSADDSVRLCREHEGADSAATG